MRRMPCLRCSKYFSTTSEMRICKQCKNVNEAIADPKVVAHVQQLDQTPKRKMAE